MPSPAKPIVLRLAGTLENNMIGSFGDYHLDHRVLHTLFGLWRPLKDDVFGQTGAHVGGVIEDDYETN